MAFYKSYKQKRTNMTDNEVKQDWSFIDKWFDEYGYTLEPKELARWAYSNGKWQHNMKEINDR
jgi:hypothetical protein